MRSTVTRRNLVLITALTGYGALVVILSVWSDSARAFLSGPPTGHTGAPGETTCTDCHSPNAITGQFNIIPPPSYVPGQTYTVQVENVTSDLSRAAWGFELTSLTSTNTVAGTFANTTAFTRTRTGGGRNYIEQTTAGAFQGQTGGSSWTFEWTAPGGDVGPITFYAAGLQANNSGDEDGDQTYTASVAVPVGAPSPTPTATATATVTATSTPVVTPTPTATATPTAIVTPTATATGTPTPLPAVALNISTRMQVDTGSNVLIGGFIVSGNASKDVITRGVGPSLVGSGISGVLADPTLELHAGNGTLIRQNDDWQDDPAQAAQISAAGLALPDPKESGIVDILPPGAYTAILAGNNNTTGVGLVEIYDINRATDSQLANISTRGFVLTGNNVMIGGFILGGTANTHIVVRGIGPTLAAIGINPALTDPTLELHDGNGMLLSTNDNWQEDPASATQLISLGLALQDPNESGIYISLSPGSFTAILAGKNGGTGIGLVEIYNVH